MKIKLNDYPLIVTRKTQFEDPLYREVILMKLMTNKVKGDAGIFRAQREFIDYIAEAKHIRTYLIAQPVSNYLMDRKEHIMEKLWKFIPEIPDDTGAILWNGWTYFYRKLDRKNDAVIVYFIAKGTQGELGMVIKEKDGTTRVQGTFSEKGGLQSIGFIISCLIVPFLTFAEHEVKVINATEKAKVKIDKEKYITDIPSDIEIVDSTWFTTIIRTEGFGVSGHFRLQPVGQGRQGRKLTWISDYEKHGYTRRAHIKKEEEK